MVAKIKNLIIGEALPTEQLHGEKFSVFWGLPILSSDAISSVAYAGEEILWVLFPVLALMSYKYMFYAALAIVMLLFLLVFSYRQTIENYPNGGGSYVVSKDNLGTKASLVAAASLSIDYILTVAVSSSAGTAAITSAIPSLLPHKVLITLILIFLLTIGNLRGIKDSSRLFGIPTYVFILSIGAMIITGLVKVHVFGYTPESTISTVKATGDMTLLLFLRAFSAGCTALTGVEAVSDGIPNFEQPAQKNAKKVLMFLAVIVLFIFGGLSYLATLYHAAPNFERTVISQIASQVFGTGFMFYLIQVTTALILVMAANTAYADFPLLLSMIARDGFAPRQFAKRGKRLSFSNGIILLWLASSMLIVIFRGETHFMLPLYAIGVFISFTLSQSGMFSKWIREKKSGWRHKAVINGFGAIVTFFTAIIIGVTKFAHGAWIVCILIPILVKCMLKVHSHYLKVAEQLRLTPGESPKECSCCDTKQHIVVPVDTLNKSFLKALNYANSISRDVVAFHISVDEAATEKLKRKWKEHNIKVPLVIHESPYRSIVSPLTSYVDNLEKKYTNAEPVMVVVPQFVVSRWWHNALHNQTALFVKNMLLRNRNIIVVSVPYILE